MIEDYGYLNARVRGMSTRLLTGEIYPALVEAAGLEGFATRLGESALYRRHLERERAESGGLDIQAVEGALLGAYTEDVDKVQQISAGDPRTLIDCYLSRYDLHNVRTLVRGIAKGRPPDEIRRGGIPLGTFSAADLDELSRSETIPALSATLSTWGLPFGEVLRQTLKAHPAEEDLLAFDAALDEAYYPWAASQAHDVSGGEDLAETLASEVDLRNIVTLLKLARQGAGSETAMGYILRAGRLSDRTLNAMASATDLKGALDIVAGTAYGNILSGMDLSASARVTDIERAVEQALMSRFSKMFRKDPLGFATILGYLWRRYTEFTDLRLIARGQAFGLPAADVRSQMVHA